MRQSLGKFITIKEAAQLLRISRSTIYQYIEMGILKEPIIIRFNRIIRINYELLENLLIEGGLKRAREEMVNGKH